MVSTAARVGSINVLLQTQFGQAVSGLNMFAGTVEKTGQRAQHAVSGIDRSVLGMNRTMGLLSGRAEGFRSMTYSALRSSTAIGQLNSMLLATSALFGGLIPTLTGTYFIRMADRAHLLENQLRTVTDGTVELKNVNEDLFQVAQRTRSSFEATATIYARTARATEHFGYSQEKLLRIAETVQKAFAVGGANSAEAKGAAIQLTQGIASDRFSGEEFRSVAENAPVLLRGIAESLGVNIGKLREMAHAGELTAKVVTEAIIDASERIDEEFDKTTSTIGQAMVQLDNAILKYVGDSDKVSVASMGIVTAINAVSDNLDTTMDALLLLGGAMASVFAGRQLNYIRQNVAATSAMRAESVLAAKAQMDLAKASAAANRSEWVQQRLAFNAALRDGNLTEKQAERQRRALEATTRRYRDSVAAAAVATIQHDAALRAASISGRAFAAAGRAASTAWNFIGGPFGAILLAIGAAMYVVSARAAEAQSRSERYADAIRAAGDDSAGAAPGIREAAASLRLVVDAATNAERQVSMLTAQNDLVAFGQELGATIQQLGTLAGGWSTISMQRDLQELKDRFLAGEISIDEFIKSVDAFSEVSPDASPIIAEIQRVAKNALAAMGVIDALKASAATIGGGAAAKTDRLTRVPSEDEFNARFGGRYAKTWEELFPDLFKKDKKSGGRSRKSAEDRFDGSIQAIYDRIAALREERETLGASFYEQTRRQEALKLEQEALRQVREEARRKGEADWQSAQISAEKRAEIERVSAALAAEADATRRATEAMEFQKDILKDVFSGLREALSDGKLEWEELGDIALRVIDKIVSRIEDDLIDALFQVNSGGSSSGGGIFGWLFGLFSGGISLPGTAPIPTPRPGLAGVPRMHGGDGLRHNELMAVLEDTENVITGDQTGRMVGALQAASASMKGSGTGSYFDQRIFKIDARGAQLGVGKEIEAALKKYDSDVLPQRVNQIAADGRVSG